MERGRGGTGEDRGLREKRWEEGERKFREEGGEEDRGRKGKLFLNIT